MSFAVALPQEWTHDRVLERIGRGLKALVLSTGRLGPKTYGSLWPSVVRDLPPLAELEQWLELRRDFEAAVHAAFERPSAEDIMLADEALAWPARYLADAPLERDAVWLTARCIGLSSKLEKILRDRRKVADFMVEQRKQNAPDIIRIYEDDAENAAAKIVAWANSAFDNPPAFNEREAANTAGRTHAHRADPKRRAHPVRARDSGGQGCRAPHFRPSLRRHAGKAVQPEPRSSPPDCRRRGDPGRPRGGQRQGAVNCFRQFHFARIPLFLSPSVSCLR